jgi:hypothetical protein
VDWSLVVTVVGAILGTALIVAGWVVYRNGEGIGSRVFGAVAIAIGVVLWLFVLFINPTSVVTRGG